MGGLGMSNKYRDYFSIDEDYFPSVNAELINSGKVDWKKFYPHDTFKKLLKDMEGVLSRQQKLSIWVEGAYGTGKSHAVLTLKKLLDASAEEMKEYFDKYNLSNDLFNKLQGAKNQGKILTIHRYGSSNIYSDRDLILAVQESIKTALAESRIENMGEEALKDAAITWLTDETHKKFFDELIKGRYTNLFEGDNVDTVLYKLKTYSEQPLITLMGKIFKVADGEGITALTLDVDGLVNWIIKIIESNNLKAIVYIWDEFMEYFLHNIHSLTGFQKLVELSQTQPLYLVIVTHKSAGLFHDTDKDKEKILGRFVRPTCIIELPENMAFKLMGAAMEKKDDPVVLADWKIAADDLNGRLEDSRRLVMQSAGITEEELMDILPIHPYTALLLKHLSSVFDSNQRSMFDFIKNDRGDEVKGFQWFIDNYGPEDYDPLLTIDMLWDFFYDKGKEHLSADIRTILDSYCRQNIQTLSSDEKKVLKTVLLLQAISQKVGDSVDLFIPNDKNVNYAYDGTELENGAATHIADKLVRDEILYKRPMGQGKFQYSAMVNAGDAVAIEKNKSELRSSKKTNDLVNEGGLANVLSLSGALSLRYEVRVVTVDNFKHNINELRNQGNIFKHKILAILTFALNDEESTSIVKMISEAVKDTSYHMLFIDTSLSSLGKDGFEQYVENMANSSYYRGKDNALANQFDNLAKDVLKKWRDRIIAGEFTIYYSESADGERFANIDAVYLELSQINIKKYKLGIEQYKVIDNMFAANSLKSGVECGAKEEVTGTFRSSNPATRLENALNGAWNVLRYWEKQENKTLLISKIKAAVEDEITKAFAYDGKVSIARIYGMLQEEPYGFMPCNLTAFVLGFLLKEYANDAYRWSDGQVSDNMSILKLKEMIDEIIKLQMTPNPRYKDKYIVTMTNEEKAFSATTAYAFNIPENQCASIEQTRVRIRTKMKELAFPIWCLKGILNEAEWATPILVLEDLINAYSGVANNNNLGGQMTEVDIALKIGKLCLEYPTATDDLQKLVTKDNCLKGMKAFIDNLDDGILVTLADEISDNGEYINVVKKKFDADAANWVWNVETAEHKIREVIIEYRIIAESNKINSKANTFVEMINEWCDKMNFIKVSYEAVKNYVDDVKPLLEILVTIKKSNMLQDSQKENFLVLIQTKQQMFRDFYCNQISSFKESCSFYIEGLSDEEIDGIFHLIPNGMFTKEKSEYFQLVEAKVTEYKKNQGKTKLRNLWKQNTGTVTPREWSTRYKTPILCMIHDEDISNAKAAFGAINSNNPESSDIHKALEYLESATIFENLNDHAKRDKCFMDIIVKGYSVLLPNVEEVRDYLSGRVAAEPYDWFASPEVEKKIKAFAEAKYNQGGSDQALQVIESMDASMLKQYLKRLIKDNMIVGMEIIKDN